VRATQAGLNLLAFDTSTEWMSIAVQRGRPAQVWQHQGPGGAHSSSQLLPQIQHLMAQAGLRLDALDAIVFGAGPGAFTGLRTACAVAQGLGFGLALPVLPVDTLLALAEQARALQGLQAPCRITALLDARMDEMYCAGYQFDGTDWHTLQPCQLIKPEQLLPDGDWLAGNVFEVYAGRLRLGAGGVITALPSAAALLRLAPALLARGQAVAAACAMPVYIRDKVALTSAERQAAQRLGVPA